MRAITKVFIVTNFVITLVILSLVFKIKQVEAQVPGFKIPCDSTKDWDPEYDSLRPYQASPCGDSPKAYFCNNDYQIVETVKTEWSEDCAKSGNQYICPVNETINKTYVVDGEGGELPILGNTEDVDNSQNKGTLTDADKMNEYLSWYLNGTTYRAEDQPLKEEDTTSNDKVVNYSGPINKLMPQVMLEAQRLNTIESASAITTFTDTENVQNPNEQAQQVTEPENHNQIVVCGKEGSGIFGWAFDFLGIGKTNPVPCYNSNNGKAQGEKYRLKSWSEGDLSAFNSLFNFIASPFGGHAWNKKYPPLPWADENGQPFADSKSYQKAYNEWRGQACTNIPGVDIQICFDNPFVPNKWAELYTYVPLANTVDKNAKHWVTGVGVRSDGQTRAEMVSYNVIYDPVLFYAHTKETYDLTKFLKSSFTPKKEEGLGSNTFSEVAKDFEQNGCKIVDVRSNPGDKLFPSSKGGRNNDLTVDVNILVTQIACPAGPIDKWLNSQANCDPSCPRNARQRGLDCTPCSGSIDCEAEIYVGVRTNPKIPYTDKITQETVTNPDSVVRRIFPKTGENSPINCIADIPGTTKISYTPGAGTDLKKVENPMGAQDPENVDLFFPGLGTIYEYMLKGIQTALRPKGYGGTITNGNLCGNYVCGDLPRFNKIRSSACTLSSISPRVGNIPTSLKQIIEAASDTYKVPPNLILGVMYGEGLFNPGRFDWTDDNVKNWATCEKVPGCNESGDDNFMGFNGDDWKNISPNIEEDLKKLGRTVKPSQCNLLDAVYGLAWNLHDSADGGMNFKCFGLDLNATIPTSCTWNDNQYASAIKIHENGYQTGCFTKENSCFEGGGNNALCPGGGDTCETVSIRATNPSHMACVFDVGHGR